jgi:class 3 adenylate cyclase
VQQQALELGDLKKGSAEEVGKRRTLEETNQRLNQQLGLNFLLQRISDEAGQMLFKNEGFRQQFKGSQPCKAYIMSINIRRSTELMLKARVPRLFAEFVISLCAGLKAVILKNYGIFDKFTGDGILAFFPEFYSGTDAGYFAVKSADECHRIFNAHYKEHRKCFTAVLKNTGLGIGIDYGEVELVEIGNELSVVGNPVVYACRMGNALPGDTLLNQPAYENIFEHFSAYCTFSETSTNFKNEGDMVAYKVFLNGKARDYKVPQWATEEPPKPA